MKFIKGNLLQAPTEALVNTVNTVGVMGKGIALQFKEAFPHNFKVYQKACKKNTLKIGELLVVEDKTFHGKRVIINFPTKQHWRQKSKIEYIEAGLQALVQVIKEHHIKSIAVPPLGCGYGGLKWVDVKLLIERYLGDLDGVEVHVYEPNEAIKRVLQSEQKPKTMLLTKPRAILLYSLFHYEALGEDSNPFVANKIIYFLQRLGEKSFKIDFEASHYGPYSVKVGYLLYYMNGVYLQGLEQNSVKPFETIHLNYDRFQDVKQFIHTKLSDTERKRVENLITFISGFESPLSLEVLASVDYVTKDNPLSLLDTESKIQNWSNRKRNLFKPYHIQVAYNHLQEYKSKLHF